MLHAEVLVASATDGVVAMARKCGSKYKSTNAILPLPHHHAHPQPSPFTWEIVFEEDAKRWLGLSTRLQRHQRRNDRIEHTRGGVDFVNRSLEVVRLGVGSCLCGGLLVIDPCRYALGIGIRYMYMCVHRRMLLVRQASRR